MGNSISSQNHPATQVLMEAADKAIAGGSIDLAAVEAAIAAGANVNARTSARHTLVEQLLLALDNSSNPETILSLFSCLLRHKAKIPDSVYGHLAKLPLEIFKLLLEQGLDVNRSVKAGVPLIYQLIDANQVAHLQVLLNFYPELVNQEGRQMDDDPFPGYEDYPALPKPLHYWATTQQFKGEYAMLIPTLFLKYRPKLAPNIIGHSLEALGEQAIKPETRVAFFNYWLNLFIQAGANEGLLEELAQPHVRAAFKLVAPKLSLIFIGLNGLAQKSFHKIAPVRLLHINILKIDHYKITKIDKLGVHFSLCEASMPEALPKHFSLSLMQFKVILDKYPFLSAVNNLFTKSIAVEDNPIVAEFFSYYQSWFNKHKSHMQIIDKLKLILENEQSLLDPHVRAFVKAPSTIKVICNLRDADPNLYDNSVGELTELISFLKEYGQQFPYFPKSLDEEGLLSTCLSLKVLILGASLKSFERIIPFLLEIGDVPLDITDNEGNSLLHLIQNPRVIKYLLDRGLDIDRLNKAGYPPLYALYSSSSVKSLLLNRGAKIEVDCFKTLFLKRYAVTEHKFWIRYFIAKGEINALAKMLADPEVYKHFTNNNAVDFEDPDDAIISINLAAKSPELRLGFGFTGHFNLSLKDFLAYEISAITEKGITFTYPVHLNKQDIFIMKFELYNREFELQSFCLSFIEFKLLLQKYALQQPVAQRLQEMLAKAMFVEKNPVVEEFLTAYAEILEPTLFKQQDNVTTTQLSTARAGLFHTDVRIIAQDEPEPGQNQNNTPS